MSRFPSREEYRLLSFELTDKFSAWFTDDDGGLFESPVHAIGMAALATVYMIPSTGETHSKVEYGNVLVALQFSDDGTADICQEANNFACVLPNGEKPSGFSEEKSSAVAMEIAGRVWCDQEMAGVTMDVNAALEIAQIIDRVLKDKERCAVVIADGEVVGAAKASDTDESSDTDEDSQDEDKD